jgi:serine/threonine protein phosphatase PrpC
MEDKLIANLNFDDQISLFGIFDGHGGDRASIFAS